MEVLTPPAPAKRYEEFAYMRAPPEADPALIMSTLLELPEFDHLRDGEAVIDWLLKRDEKVRGGRQILGTAHLPRVQGDLKPCFEWLLECYFGHMPDFLIILDYTYWMASSPRNREILAYHELCHCIHKENGLGEPLFDENERPRWGLKGHDVEEFTAVVRRYGAWNADLEYFLQAAQSHAREARFAEGIGGGPRAGAAAVRG